MEGFRTALGNGLRMARAAHDVAVVASEPEVWRAVALQEERLDLGETWRRSSAGDPLAAHALAILHAPLVAYIAPVGPFSPGDAALALEGWALRLVGAVGDHRPGRVHFLDAASRAVALWAPPRPGDVPSCGRLSGRPDPAALLAGDLAALAEGEPVLDLAQRRGIGAFRALAVRYLAVLYEGDLPPADGAGGAGVREPRRPRPSSGTGATPVPGT